MSHDEAETILQQVDDLVQLHLCFHSVFAEEITRPNKLPEILFERCLKSVLLSNALQNILEFCEQTITYSQSDDFGC